MDNFIFYHKGESYLTFGLRYLYGSKVKVEHLDNIQESTLDKFFVVGFSRDIKNYLYSYDFLDDASAVIKRGGKVLIDYTLEADTAIRPCIVYLLENIKEAKLPLDSFRLVYNNSYHLEPYKANIRGYELTTMFFPYLMIEAHRQQSTYFEPTGEYYDSSKAEKDFLMLNRRVGTNKFPPIHEMVQRGWNERAMMTFVDMRPNLKGIIGHKPDWLQTLKTLGLTNPITKPLQLDNDIQYGTELAWSDQHLYRVNPEWYQQARINIVVETWYESTIPEWDSFDNMVHMTEKVFKSIGFNCPFVIISGKGYLDRLNKLGFQTDFLAKNTPIHYDATEDVNRFQLALDLAERYAKSYHQEDMKSICLQNQKHFLNLDNHRKIVGQYFLRHLLDKKYLV